MTTNNQNPNMQENLSQTETTRNREQNTQYGVQTAQTTAVNPPDAKIPANTPTELSKQQLEAFEEQEEGKLPTTDGYVIDESGRIDNYAVEPPMYVEGEEPKS